MCTVDDHGGERTLSDRKPEIPIALLASLNLLGLIGSVFSTALGGYVTTRRLENIEDTLRVMGEKLEGTDPGQVEDYLCSDEFIHLFLTAVQKAQIDHQKEKRQLYGAMLGNMALDRETEYEQKDMFISMLSQMEIVHVRSVRYLQGKAEDKPEEGKWASFEEIRSANASLMSNSKYMTVAVLQELARWGLIMSKGEEGRLMSGTNPIGLWFQSLYAITDVGVRFLEFLNV